MLYGKTALIWMTSVVAVLMVASTGSQWATANTRAAVVQGDGGGSTLAATLLSASAGDTIVVGAGHHMGALKITKSLTLLGKPGAIIDAQGLGSAIEVLASDVTIKGLEIVGSGIDHEQKDSGIFLGKEAARAIVKGNYIHGNLVGVYVWGTTDAVVADNRIEGRTDLRMNDRGNGIYVWNAPGARVSGNDISGGRDGIFVNVSHDNVFEGNSFRNLRFALHYMHTNDSVVRDNVSIGNHAGFALMFSHHLDVTGNVSIGDRDHGIFLNFTNDSRFEGNMVKDGLGKCVFIYNSNKNAFKQNWFEHCDIGVHFTGGSERNSITESAFVGSRTQVKYVGTRLVDWSENGVGNYWSDNPAVDLNGDGISDAPFKPNDLVDQIMWQHPEAIALMTSPAVQILRWAQGQFPALATGGVIDRAPLISPPQLQLAVEMRDFDE